MTPERGEGLELDPAEMRAKWEGYEARLRDGDGYGSLAGASFIIARSAVTDIFVLLDALSAAPQSSEGRWEKVAKEARARVLNAAKHECSPAFYRELLDLLPAATALGGQPDE